MNLSAWIAASGAVLVLLTIGCGGRICLFPTTAPSFFLTNRHGSKILNTNLELHEQSALFKHWDASYDTGINIGVYVGTSCILLDKMLEANQASGMRTACVEPNTMVLPKLKENLATNGRNLDMQNIQILHGIMSDKAHCPDGAEFLDGTRDEAVGSSLNGSTMTWKGMGDDNDAFTVSRCYSADHVRKILGKLPSVWYIDCDGCLPDTYKQMRTHFSDPSVKLFFYERESFPGSDVSEAMWEAKYREMEEGLRAQGFVAKQCSSNSLWGVWVWQRGGPNFRIHAWCLAIWTALLAGASFATDAGARRLSIDLPVPLWRMLVLPVWLGVYRRLPILPINLKEPITGLDCTWTCVHEGLAFGLSNFAFLYPAVFWQAARAVAQRFHLNRYLLFLAVGQAGLLAGFLYHALVKPAPLCQGPGPMQSIWEVTVVVALALCIVAIRGKWVAKTRCDVDC
mmetsp:Transcript_64931/g.152745  ORF Transcript_64931/g.152745 Transcript_64931/m.152745 type:complete len:455 (-) Transcript_64931:16-1380(-)